MRILVTGGTGYIGSHTCISLLEKGYDVTIVDNLVNSKALVVDRIEALSGKKVKFFEADVCDAAALRRIFAEDEIFAVIHFAGLKAVGESVQIPLRYYENNLVSTLSLLQVMEQFKVKSFVFSSCATVYGNPASVPIREDFPLSTTNPYGTTKLMIERILLDYAHANPDFNPIILRYFNPVGAHESGTIGEDPNGIRGPERHSEQPCAVHHAGGGRKAQVPRRFRRRLPDEGRHGRARLHPCGRSRRRPCGGAQKV